MHLHVGRGLIAAVVSLGLVLGTTADAGDQWSLADPLFDIDGRSVEVQAAVSPDCTDVRVHFTLVVAEGADASWQNVPGSVALDPDQVTILEGKSRHRDRAHLVVSVPAAAKDPACRVRAHASGSGLRGGDIDREGNGRAGVRLDLRLTRTADPDDD